VVKGKQRPGIWSLPKGRIQDQETEEECAIRELYEETGIRLDTVANLPRIVIGRNVYFISYINKYNLQTFNIIDKKEVEEVSWKTIYELRNMICNKDIRHILQYPDSFHPVHRFVFRQNARY
jgi:8-oxo-dGTP pyrophosphatase MutT (NUDIX family)